MRWCPAVLSLLQKLLLCLHVLLEAAEPQDDALHAAFVVGNGGNDAVTAWASRVAGAAGSIARDLNVEPSMLELQHQTSQPLRELDDWERDLLTDDTPEGSRKPNLPARTEPGNRPDYRITSDSQFGPNGCVSVVRSKLGTCLIQTDCGDVNLANVDFSFGCFNEGTAMPHALHTYGRGGFASRESFDTGVKCQKCASVASSLASTGPIAQSVVIDLPAGYNASPPEGPEVILLPGTAKASEGASQERNVELQYKEMPPRMESRDASSSAPSLSADAQSTDATETTVIAGSNNDRRLPPAQAAFYGPNSCISTFLSSEGTCVIDTRCGDVSEEMAQFNVGVTCVRSGASYTRYLYGKASFAAAERFDTMVQCQACLGVSGSGPTKPIPPLPQTVLTDMNALKAEVRQLRDLMSAIQDQKTSAGKGTDKQIDEGEAKAATKATANDEGNTGEGEKGEEKKAKERSSEDSREGESDGQGEKKIEYKEVSLAPLPGSAGHEVHGVYAPAPSSPAWEALAPAPALAEAPAAATIKTNAPAPASALLSNEESRKSEFDGLAAAPVVRSRGGVQMRQQKIRMASVERDVPMIIHHRRGPTNAFPAFQDVSARLAE